jgi:hypothetical protein
MAGLIDTSSRNLAAELVRHRKTRGDLAKAWGCALNTVDRRLDGSIPLTIKEIEEAAPVFDMDSTQLVMLLIQPIDSIKQFKA